jgi:putative DNA primase/helicase
MDNGIPKVYPKTDMGNANMFADMFGEKVRYDHTTGKWLAWDGRRWARDGGEEKAQLYCRGIAMYWYQKLADCEEKEETQKLFRHWQYTASATGVRNLLFLAKSEPGISVSNLSIDQHPFLLNVLDGTIDLRTGEIKKHDPSDMITQLAPVEYGTGEGERGTGKWTECLNTWHPEDDGTIEYLQKLMGYCLTGSTTSRCFPIFWGSGKNGKNVFLDTFREMMGDYASNAAETLVEANARSEHPTELADLWTKRLVLASEPKKGSKLKVGLVKRMTGDRVMKARFMRQDFFEFVPTHKVVMMTQNMPIIDETSDAIWDRIHKVQWGVRISEEKQNPNLTNELRAEWPGILRWAVRGCLEWQKPPGFLKMTRKIERDTHEYRNEQHPAKRFVEENFMVGAGMIVPCREVDKALAQWNEDSLMDRVLTKTEVVEYLRELKIVSKATWIGGTTVKAWRGMGVRSIQNGNS